MYENGKMRPAEIIPGIGEVGIGEVGIKENDGGLNSTKIFCKNFVNVTMYPQYNNNKKEKKHLKMSNIFRY
jgi:hypothetical protein